MPGSSFRSLPEARWSVAARIVFRWREGVARWQNGYAEACKAFYVGSIPARASKVFPA